MKQSNVLNLLRIYIALIDCSTACRIELKKILPDSELHEINKLQNLLVSSIQLFDGQSAKDDESLTPEEVYQLHLFTSAKKLSQLIVEHLDD